MKTRTVIEIYYNSPDASENDDAVLIGRGLDKASAWADAAETAGEPIEDLEPYCYEHLDEQPTVHHRRERRVLLAWLLRCHRDELR